MRKLFFALLHLLQLCQSNDGAPPLLPPGDELQNRFVQMQGLIAQVANSGIGGQLEVFVVLGADQQGTFMVKHIPCALSANHPAISAFRPFTVANSRRNF